MQLFLTDFVHKDMSIIIENPIVLDQLKKVLRMQKGDIVAVQKSNQGINCRYVVRIDDWDHQRVYGTVIETIDKPDNLGSSITMYVAMPNKRDKAELIAQKLAELGVSHIVFWRAERSILREMNEKKVARIQKIMQEAVEQSWGWYMPHLTFVLDKDFVVDEKVVIFDVPSDTGLLRQSKAPSSQGCIGIVGPEGGLTQRDYEHFPHHIVSGLGNTILRMETAAIVGAYELKGKKVKGEKG